MGANAVNTMAEALAPQVESLTGGQVYLRIPSNLADRRLRMSELFDTREHTPDRINERFGGRPWH